MKALRVVQTEVDSAIHARLQHLAAKKAMPLKVVVRKALVEYVEREEGALEEDSIFRLVGSLDIGGRDWSTRKDWRP